MRTIRTKALSRRAILRGLGGFAVALPFLEIMTSSREARAQAGPSRYVFAFGGSSLGMDGAQMVVPSASGPLAGNLTRGLAPLEALGVVDDVSMVSGLLLPWDSGSGIPTAGRAVNFHASSPAPLVTGVAGGETGDERLKGPSTDQIVADAIAGGVPHRALTYRVQPAYYRGSNGTGGDRGRITARMNGGELEQIDPIISPRLAFENLFSGFAPPDPEEAEAAAFLLARRKSVLDLVHGDTERLLPRLGARDRQRLERHFDEIRALEGRLAAIEPPTEPACAIPGVPESDPPIGNAVENGDTGGYAAGGAYSGEEERARIMIDLVHMAFACDLARVASIMFTQAQCFMNMAPIYGADYATDLHEMSHGSMGGGDAGAAAMADGVAWHVKHWATLVQKLRDTEDGGGASLLDTTALVLAFEGGIGFDPEGGGEGMAHSTENMAVLVAGRAGGLVGGQHVVADGEHPAAVINTAMRAVGCEQDLGDVAGTIDALLA
jgi:hypothetical protein